MPVPSPKVDALFTKATRWQDEMTQLRGILLGSGLAEDMKWGKACYAQQGGNVCLLFRYKNHCAVGFLKGALLKDRQGDLVSPGKNSQAMRMMKFTSLQDIEAMQPVLLDFIAQAIANESAGLKIDFVEKHELVYPDELVDIFDENPEICVAFEALTPGRQRGYVLHFSAAKHAATRRARIEKAAPKIQAGKGLADR